MSPIAQPDAIIVGAGLSGLSLAIHLAAGGWADRRVLVVDDQRPGVAGWASWTARPGLLDAAATRTYRRVQVHAGGVARRLDLGAYRYQVVPHDELRRLAEASFGPGFAFVPGSVTSVRDEGHAAAVCLDGRTLRASWVFDSRPAPVPEPDARLAFTGWRIHSGHPLFDPAVPTLFDFRIGGCGFAYVLPDSPRRALVEVTAFVPGRSAPPPPAERRSVLAAYVRDVLGAADYDAVEAESSVLPLCTRPVDRGRGRVVAIGARAGLIKASTGYAFQRIQRDSAAIAASLACQGHPYDRPRSHPRHRWLDRVMLRVLDRDPAALEVAFARLFGGRSAEPVLRFLDEDTGPLDELRLIRSLPPGPYLRALGP
jgi:lycopene beta-cyclase